ncbi:hypothetical protein LDE01_02500 [Lactobacillus delbrueckii subsp. delbrueckii]|nr:hypothetical protein LDE01_02500 [Lactobacillus delbrueckii subsp. delbrueckii]
MDLLKTVFGIDVSSRKSNVCIMVNGQKVNDYAISNDMVGFNQLLGDLKQVTITHRLSLKQLSSIPEDSRHSWTCTNCAMS